MRGFYIHIRFIFLFLFFLHGNLYAQSGKGSPVIQNYLPKLYKEVSNSAQNWSFVQDKRGVMYIGNTEGLMEYDGCRWRIVHTSNNSVVRSLDIDHAGRIYVGGSGDFGYISFNSKGESYFVSLSMLLKPRDRDFSDVWATYTTKSGVYFVTNNRIFKYKDRKIKLIYSTSRISAFKAFDRIFIINKTSSGIYRIDKDRFELMPNTQGIRAVALSEFMGNKLIGVAADNSFFTYDLQNVNSIKKQDAVKPFQTELSRLYGSGQTAFFQIRKSNNNQFVVNTLYNGVYIIDPLGRVVNILNTKSGLTSNSIYNFYIDTDNRLWLALNKGFANVDLNSPTSIFNEQNGLDGNPISLINFRNNIYIGTEKSLFYLDCSKVGTGQLAPVANYQEGAAWDFLNVNDRLLVASSNGLFHIEGSGAKKISDVPNVYSLCRHPQDKSVFFAGTENSLLKFKIDQNINPTDFHIVQQTPIVENTNPIRSLAVDVKGNLWASSNFKGVYFVQFSKDQSSLPSVVLADTANGLRALNGNLLSMIRGEVYISTNNGIYSAKDLGRDGVQFRKNSGFAASVNKLRISVDQLFSDPKKRIWLFSEKMGFGQLLDKGADLEWNQFRFSTIPSYEINKYAVDGNDIVWGLSNNCIYRIDLAGIRRNHSRFNALIRGVRLSKDSILFAGDQPGIARSGEGAVVVATLNQATAKVKEIDYKNNSLIFDFASTCYTDESQVQYSYKLEGFDNQWSEWSFANTKEFARLFEGRYTLHIRARNTYGQVSQEAVYAFRILAPWYRSVWAGILYLLVLAYIFRNLYNYITKKFRLDKARLESLIQERTSLISQKNQELIKNRSEVIAQKEQLELQSKRFEEMSIEHEKLSIVASKTENAVLIMDEEGNFEWVNDSYERLFGYTLEELKTLISPNIIGKNTPDYVKAAVENCMTNKISVGYEFSTLSRNGEKLWVQVTLTPILDEKGQIYKIIAVDTDITRTKNTELELIKRSEEIRSQISLFDSQQKYIENLKGRVAHLKDFSKSIFNVTDYNAISLATRQFLEKIIDTSFFGLGIYNKQRETLEFTNFYENGLILPYFTNSIHQANSFSAWCIRNKSELYIADIEKSYSLYLDDEPEFETISKPRSLIYVPLVVDGEALGVITVHSAETNAYREDDLHILHVVASLISSSVMNVAHIKLAKGLELSIQDSLQHGKGALNLMLPEKGMLDRFYKSFIIYRPKDTISGDFYWFSRVQSEGMLLKTIVVVGDATGHDSTGAFIAMVTMYLLSEIVEKRKIYQPSRILDLLDEKLINYLTVEGDDIEICVCLLEQTADGGTVLSFSGAKRPIHIFKSSENQILTIKGTRRPLGDKKSSNLIAFKSETIVLNSGDLVYLATDGMNNQTNMTSQKFSTETLCKVLKDNAYRPLHEQKERLDYSFDFFKGGEKQRDDIVVVGIKV